MKKEKMIALLFGGIVTVSSLFGGKTMIVNANENAQTNTKIEEKYDNTLSQELLENNVLNEKELKQYNEANNTINKLYDEIGDEEISDELWDKLNASEEKVYMDNKEVFDKVDEYFVKQEVLWMDEYYNELVESKVITKEEALLLKSADEKVAKLMDSLDINLSDEDYYEIDEQINNIYDELSSIYDRISDFELYQELEEVLSKSEIEQYKKAEEKIKEIYKNFDESDFDDEKFEKLLAQEELVYKEFKAVFDKVDAYFEKIYEEDFEEVLGCGELTKEEIDKLDSVGKEASRLFGSLNDNATYEEIKSVYEQIEALYENL